MNQKKPTHIRKYLLKTKPKYTPQFNHFLNRLEVKLDKIGTVKFGARDPVKIGHTLLAVNGQPVYLEKMEKNKLKIDDLKGANDLHEYLENSANFPCQLRFGKPSLTTNDKLVLTGRFFGFVYLNFELK